MRPMVVTGLAPSIALAIAALVVPPAAAAPTAAYARLGRGVPVGISPDGGWVALADEEAAPDGWTQLTLARADGSAVRVVQQSLVAVRPQVLLRNDGSAVIADGAYYVAPDGVAAVPYRGMQVIEGRMREDRALGWSPDGEHLVLGRPGRAPTRVLRRPAGAAAQVVIARDGRSAVVLPLRGPIRAFWRIDLSGRARRVSTGAPLDVLRFDASLRHAVGVVRGHHVVRLFELGADSLVGRGRIRTAARVNAYISPNGHWVATARRLRRLPIRYHIGRFGQALVTRPRWHTGATRFLRFAVADDGSALYAVATGRNGPEVARTLDARSPSGFATPGGCAGRRVEMLGRGAFTCIGRDPMDDLDPRRVSVTLPSGTIPLTPPDAATGETAVAASNGRVIAFEATPTAGGPPATWIAAITP